MVPETLRVTNLTLTEAEELLAFLDAELPQEVRPDGFTIRGPEDAERATGLSAFPEPVLILAFAKGFATAIGAGFGKLLFDKLREWAKSRKTDATLVEGDKAKSLTDLPENPVR